MKPKKLGRNQGERKALFKSQIRSLVTFGAIRTTEIKARAVRGIVEKLLAQAKLGTLASRRVIVAFLQDKKVVSRLVEEIAPKFQNRSSGFTRITRIGKRAGDGAMMVKLEFVERVDPWVLKGAKKEEKETKPEQPKEEKTKRK